MLLNDEIRSLLKDDSSQVTVLSGAGIYAESGIPTLRGADGYWAVGSNVYMPQEMATLAMFNKHSDEVWQRYLFRSDTCMHVVTNAGHFALADKT